MENIARYRISYKNLNTIASEKQYPSSSFSNELIIYHVLTVICMELVISLYF